MVKALRIVTGLLSFWPVFYVPFYFAMFDLTADVGHCGADIPYPSAAVVMSYIYFVTTPLIVILALFYIIVLFGPGRVSPVRKAAWVVFLLLAGIIANPLFWYLHIRRQSS